MNWSKQEKSEQFDKISDEIISSSTKTRNVIFVVIACIGLILATVLYFKAIGQWSHLSILIMFMLLGAAAIIIQLSSQACETHIKLCKLFIDDNDKFLSTIAQVRCGATAIQAFLHLTDSAISLANNKK